MNCKKYHSTKCCCRQAHTHHSKKEASRCDELHQMQRADQITDLQIQRRFELIPPQQFTSMSSERSCCYIADFTYFKDGIFVIEDCKGYRTTDYKIKRKLMKQRYCSDGNAVFIET